MQARLRSLRKLLIWRLLGLAILLSMLTGGGVFIRENNQLEAAATERTRMASELLRLRVRDLAQTSQQPWQTIVQTAMDSLRQITPQSVLGRFAWVSVRNNDRQEIAHFVEPGYANLQSLIDVADQQVFNEPLVIQSLEPIDGNASFAIGLIFTDYGGHPQATLRGIYVVSSEIMASFWRNIIYSVGASMLVVLLVSMLHYPVIRDLVERLGRLSIRLLDANLETLQGFGSAIAKRDSDTDAHNFRVTIYAVKLAEAVGVEPNTIRTLIKGAFLHDVGKIGIRDAVLLKPGRLDDAEFEIMKTHVKHGLDIVSNCHWLLDAAEVVGNHHEKFDGSGYYRGLKGENIPITARIFAIVDVFDALTSKRPYKSALSLEESMVILQRNAGSHFDPALLKIFESISATLYEQFANHEEQARSELARIVGGYFKSDMGDLL